MKVWLHKTQEWAEVLAENELFLVATSSDGILTYVLRDNMCYTKGEEQ